MTDHATTDTTRILEDHSPFARSLGRIRQFIRNWKSRRAVQRLAAFDDHMLADIGVSSLDIHWAAGLPLTMNAALALEERARLRRAGRIRSWSSGEQTEPSASARMRQSQDCSADHRRPADSR